MSALITHPRPAGVCAIGAVYDPCPRAVHARGLCFMHWTMFAAGGFLCAVVAAHIRHAPEFVSWERLDAWLQGNEDIGPYLDAIATWEVKKAVENAAVCVRWGGRTVDDMLRERVGALSSGWPVPGYIEGQRKRPRELVEVKRTPNAPRWGRPVVEVSAWQRGPDAHLFQPVPAHWEFEHPRALGGHYRLLDEPPWVESVPEEPGWFD